MNEQAVLVTGGAGYIGSLTTKLLLKAGYKPVVFDNMSEGHEWALQWGDFVHGDVRDTGALIKAIETYRPVAIVHFAAFIAAGESVQDPAKYYDNNVGGMISLLKAMRQTSTPSLVFSSTAAVFSSQNEQPLSETSFKNPENPYGWSKLMCEEMIKNHCKAYGTKAAIFRYFNAAGADPESETGEAHDPETHLIPLVLETAIGKRPAITVFGNDYDTPDGTCVRDYIHVADLAEAHILALSYLENCPQGSFDDFNLGIGKGHSVLEVIETCKAVTGLPISVKSGERRAGDPAQLTCDPTKANRVLNWTPRYTSLSDKVEHAWQWLKNSKP